MDLITQIAKVGGTTIKEAEAFYNIFEKVLTTAITNYSEVILSAFIGRFILKTHPGGQLTNFKGKKIFYDESTIVAFKISSSLKKLVKQIKLT
ncbi:HU family DNA-binding protein [Candidatus Phytoplasma sp. AldY-WA1]|uniref:HU family DNA-binding protein n=1 Tax=Candidatus Phytoplasma sp. AldY-WA1 TaxID=2852100 RepID=UPI00254BB7CF|nr:HU family DNA-binding protein [Candidatus Phytoplasma sp. AldY-WA1]